MKITKSVVITLSVASALALTPFSSTSYAADFNTPKNETNDYSNSSVSMKDPSKSSIFQSNYFSTPTKLTDEEIAESRKASVNQFVTLPNAKSPHDIKMMSDIYYDFWGLGAGRKVTSNGSVKTTKNSDIYITLVQWTPSSTYPAYATYYLENTETGNKTTGKTVDGTFKSENVTIGWSNVLPGTYRIVIENTGDHELEGNGYLNVYYDYN